MANKILSPREISDLQAEKKEIEAGLQEMAGAGKGTPAEGINKNHMLKRSVYIDRVIYDNNHLPTGVSKDIMSKETKILEERIKEGMPSSDEMNRPEKHPGAVMKHHLWSKNNAALIHRWKQLRRRLDPSNPTVSNIESLRRR